MGWRVSVREGVDARFMCALYGAARTRGVVVTGAWCILIEGIHSSLRRTLPPNTRVDQRAIFHHRVDTSSTGKEARMLGTPLHACQYIARRTFLSLS